MPEKNILEFPGALLAALALIPSALLARLLYHQRLVRLGKRRMWSWELVWEVPTAALCAVMAGGIGEYLALSPLATHAAAGVLGWLGPRGLEVVVARHTGVEPTGDPRNAEKED